MEANYYKTIRGRRAGRLTVIVFHKITEEENIHVDTVRNRIRVNKTFGGLPYELKSATKREFEEAHDKVMAYTNLRHL